VTSLQTALGVLGGLLVVGALLSGLARRSMLSLAALFVVIGFMLGDGAIGVLHFRANSPFVSDLTTVALVVILFRDGLEVESELLQAHWHLPLRKLVLGMPITAAVIAVVAHSAVASPGSKRSYLARCFPLPTRSFPQGLSVTRACRASSDTRSIWSQGSTTA
jgi:NhaP-type Na+/H+ or K+/H+ antiporter